MEQDNGASSGEDRATHEQSQQAVSAVPVGIPSALVSADQVAGALAMWAIRQSPYPCPGNLGFVVERFTALWPVADQFGFRSYPSEDALFDEIKRVCEDIPELLAWNEPKSEHGAEMVFVSRYGGPEADDDFIDLYALWGNTARTVWAEEMAAQGIEAEGGDGEAGSVHESPVGNADAPETSQHDTPNTEGEG